MNNQPFTTHVIFEPRALVARLAALIPKLLVNLTRFHAVNTEPPERYTQYHYRKARFAAPIWMTGLKIVAA